VQPLQHSSKTLHLLASRADTPHMNIVKDTLQKAGDLLYAIMFGLFVALGTVMVGTLAVLSRFAVTQGPPEGPALTPEGQGWMVMVYTAAVCAGKMSGELEPGEYKRIVAARLDAFHATMAEEDLIDKGRRFT
jgi:hypothetical protein